MSPEIIKYHRKVDSFREVLNQHGFETFQYFWYTDGFYNSLWKDMSVAAEKPDREERTTMWQFGFRSQNQINKRIHMEAIIPYTEDYFTFELRYYPEVELHEDKGFYGPSAMIQVSGILEKHLTNMQKYIDYLLKHE